MAHLTLLPAALILGGAFASSAAPHPSDVAARAIARYAALPVAGLRMLTLPDYGPSIALSAMYDAAGAFQRPDWAAFVSALLDEYAADATSNAYAVLHNAPVPWGYSVGDTMGLWPIVYLSRALAAGTPVGVGDDWELASVVAEKYVLGWPLRLGDAAGTLSRNVSWAAEPTNNATLCKYAKHGLNPYVKPFRATGN